MQVASYEFSLESVLVAMLVLKKLIRER
jgi:hypothetical protein